MKTFISEVVSHLVSEAVNFDNTSFIFPSKRAGRFLIRHLNEVVDKTMFSPKTYSIEEFVEMVSELAPLDATHSIFKLYETYQKLTPKEEQEDFETFYGWSQTLLHDFNEIDRYLIDPESIFNYLSSIQDIKHWSKQEKKTELVTNYLQFWHRLPKYYAAYKALLVSEKTGYQGLQYRTAAEKIDGFLSGQQDRFIFIGFNALNTAEQQIIQAVLHSKKGSVFWDMDRVFFEDEQHGASHFLRQYAKWPYYASNKNPFQWITDNYQQQKKIEIIGVPKNVGQAKHIGNILSEIPKEALKKTAVVLGDEAMILPMLNSLPENITELNITMGLSLGQTPLASLFAVLFKIHSADSSRFYFKQIIEIIHHPAIVPVLGKTPERIFQRIRKDNRIFMERVELVDESDPMAREILEICFDNYRGQPLYFLESLERLTRLLKQPGESIRNETLYHFNKLFKKLITLIGGKTPVKNIKTLYPIYQNSLRTASLDFSGSPFDGLQLMGMLETRSLDFETVIISSVNEGILPAGKGAGSFIPYDLKKEYGLPTYKEKDAVYTYHFYRLLQQAKNIYLLYNAVPGDLNAGEKSRFITQLITEKQAAHTLKETTLAPYVPSLKKELKSISKTPEILQKMQALATHGFSPSALLTYIRNPLDFYNKYVLGVRETEEVEETVAANTLGTVVHDTLEKLYAQDAGKAYFLTNDHLETMFQEYEAEVIYQFKEHYHTDKLATGKNLIIFEVAKRYVLNFLKKEKESLRDHQIEILGLEIPLKAHIPIDALDFPVFLKGKSDRIDRFNGMLRIIDYKTGKVAKTDVEIIDWGDIVLDYKYAKAFQVLCYAYMYAAENPTPLCEAGIISFKNLNEGFLNFAIKRNPRDRNKQHQISPDVLTLFEEQLKKLVGEICDPEIPFTEKEIDLG